MDVTSFRMAMENGHSRFRHEKSGKIYTVDRASSIHLFDDGDHDDITVIGYPEERHPRKRGRQWQFISPKSLEVAG